MNKIFKTTLMSVGMAALAVPAYSGPPIQKKAPHHRHVASPKRTTSQHHLPTISLYPERPSRSKVASSLQYGVASLSRYKRTAMPRPSYTPSSQAEIYGYATLCYDWSPMGWYKIGSDGQADHLWTDKWGLEETGLQGGWITNDGVLHAYVVDIQFGFIIMGEYYVELDAKTGELLKEVTFDDDASYIFMTAAHDTETNTIYGYTFSEDMSDYHFSKCIATDPLNTMQVIKRNVGTEVCQSLAWYPDSDELYGFNVEGNFVSISLTTGEQMEILKSPIKGMESYLSGMCFSPVDNAMILTPSIKDESTQMWSVSMDDLSVTRLAEQSYDYQFLVCMDEANPSDGPSSPEIISENFIGAELAGSIQYRLPSTTNSGEILTEELEWTATINGEFWKSGKANPGSELSVGYDVQKSGPYAFRLNTVCDGYKGKPSVVSRWMGYDQPESPLNVSLTEGLITWEAVTQGKHEGYLDMDNFSYDVYLNDDKIGNTTQTNYTPSFQEGEIQPYRAKVIAVNNDVESYPGLSNYLAVGSPLKPDVNIAGREADLCMFTVIDSNSDGKTWRYNEEWDCLSCNASGDDWLILPPINIEDPNVAYEFGFKTLVIESSKEEYEVYVGTYPDQQGMIRKIGDSTTIGRSRDQLEKWIDEENRLLTFDEAGVYYIGLRNSGKWGWRLYAKDFKVTATDRNTNGPAAVSNLSATPFEKGELKASVEFTMPTHCLNGKIIEESQTLTANVAVGEYQAVTLEGLPGQTLKTEVDTEQGIQQINVRVNLGEVNGDLAVIDVYTGIDKAGYVQNFKGKTTTDNMTIHLTWEAPSEIGVNGGYVNPEAVTYYLAEYDQYDRLWYVVDAIGQGILEYDYELPANAPQQQVGLGIVTETQAGMSERFAYAGFQAGKLYALPMTETLPEGVPDLTPLLVSGDCARWDSYYKYDFCPGDENDPTTPDYCIAARPQRGWGEYSMLYFPRFSTKGTTSPAIEIYCWGSTAENTLYGISCDSDEPVVVGEIDPGYWHSQLFELPKDLQDKGWVQLCIAGKFDEVMTYVAFSEYTVFDAVENDFAAISGSGETTVLAGSTVDYELTLLNRGTKSQLAPEVEAVAEDVNGNRCTLELTEKAAGMIESNSRLKYRFNFTPSDRMGGDAQIKFRISTPDQSMNNQEVVLPIRILKGDIIRIDDLKAEICDGSVELTWSDPSLSVGLEGFEENFKNEITSNLGRFKAIDADGEPVYIFDGFDAPNEKGDPMAFMVWNYDDIAERIGNESVAAGLFKPYEGSQALVAVCPMSQRKSNDWLISPAVKSNTQVSFMLDIITDEYGSEVVEILYSDRTDDVDDFTVLKTVKKGTKGWEKISVELPEDARYFAIHYVSKDIFGIFIDAISYTPVDGNVEISGYRVYRNGEEKAIGIQTSFIDPSPVAGRNSYCVIPVFTDDLGEHEGVMSNVVTIETSGIGNISQGKSVIRGGMGEIEFNGLNEEYAVVYSSDGIIVRNVRINSDAMSISIEPGIYIVKVSDRQAKVVVR